MSTALIVIEKNLFEQEPSSQIFTLVMDKLREGAKEITIDFSSCRAVSVFGISQLIQCSSYAESQGAKLKFEKLKPEYETILKGLELNKFFKF